MSIERMYTGTAFEAIEEKAIAEVMRKSIKTETKAALIPDFVQECVMECLKRGFDGTAEEAEIERAVNAAWVRTYRAEKRNSWRADSLDRETEGTDGRTLAETISDSMNIAEQTENKVMIEQAKARLETMFTDETEKAVARLYILQNMGIRTIAEQLGISVWTARKTLDRVKSRLHQ